MRISYTLHLIGILILFLGLSMVAPLLISFLYNDGSSWALLSALLVTVLSGSILYFAFKAPEGDVLLTHREGILIVALGWFAAGLFGTLPFLFAGTFDTFVNALFESVSGFTTTGASVISNIESQPKGILFWRSLTQWLGGMGIIVLSLAILPFLGVGGMQLYRAEIPAPVVDKLKPRISETAKLLWKVYLLISLAEVLFLCIGGMNVFDSLCHTFATMATGGFSTKNASVGHYKSVYFDCIIIFFMLMAGINFSLHYQFLKGKVNVFWKNQEFRFFITLVAILTAVVTFNLYTHHSHELLQSLRHGAFQVCSIITTTGYTTTDFGEWPALSQNILLICMFIGASAGSTGGGIKCLRIMLLLKHSYRELFRIIHPRAIAQLKLAGKAIPSEVINSIWGFFALYLGLFIIASSILAAMGVDLISSLSAVAATLGNIGPGLGIVGPAQNYADIPYLGKWVLIFCMLLGRLEIYTVIILFVPEYWKK